MHPASSRVSPIKQAAFASRLTYLYRITTAWPSITRRAMMPGGSQIAWRYLVVAIK